MEQKKVSPNPKYVSLIVNMAHIEKKVVTGKICILCEPLYPQTLYDS